MVLGFAHTKCEQNTCTLKTPTSVKLPEPESNPSLCMTRARIELESISSKEDSFPIWRVTVFNHETNLYTI